LASWDGLGRLAAWHFPGGPVGPASRWAAKSNAEVWVKRFTQITGKEEKISEGQSYNEEERDGGSRTAVGDQGS